MPEEGSQVVLIILLLSLFYRMCFKFSNCYHAAVSEVPNPRKLSVKAMLKTGLLLFKLVHEYGIKVTQKHINFHANLLTVCVNIMGPTFDLTFLFYLPPIHIHSSFALLYIYIHTYIYIYIFNFVALTMLVKTSAVR